MYAYNWFIDGSPTPVLSILNNDDHYANDGNLTISILHIALTLQFKELKRMQKEDDEEQRKLNKMSQQERAAYEKSSSSEVKRKRNTCVPETLYLQFDNASNNKCEAVFRYCAWLVKTGVFKKVRVGFMLVGHTHDIVDQMFSRISEYLKSKDTLSIDQYLRDLPLAYRYRVRRSLMKLLVITR